MPSAALRKRPRPLPQTAPRPAARKSSAIARSGRSAAPWRCREIWRTAGFGASECLTEADIDLDQRIGRAPPQRRRHIETQRPERRVVAQPETRTIENPGPGLRQRAAIEAAGIEKRHD